MNGFRLPSAVLAALAIGGYAGVPVAAADDVSFESPSGNIACLSAMSYVRCDVRDRDWSPPPRPSDCPSQTGYGQGITLKGTGRPAFVCGGDSTFGADAYTLGYGQAHSVPDYRCESGQSGITCANSDGHGFTIARDAYRLF